MMRRSRWWVRVALLAVAVAVAVPGLLAVAGAAPAAHTVGGVEASNYRTRIRSVEPAMVGLRVAVVTA